jgi:phage shock protein C
MAMTCARCLKDVEDGSAFCRFCGASITAAQPDPAAPPKRLVRIPEEGRVGGVCAGIGSYLDADVTLVRLAWVILSVAPGLILGGLIAYVACWILLPAATPANRHSYRGSRLSRSVADRQIAGVCGGLAEYLGVDPFIVRVVTVVLAIYPGAVIGGILAYGVAWLIMPSAQTQFHPAANPT